MKENQPLETAKHLSHSRDGADRGLYGDVFSLTEMMAVRYSQIAITGEIAIKDYDLSHSHPDERPSASRHGKTPGWQPQ